MAVDIRQLAADDVALMRGLLAIFGAVFHDERTYVASQPGDGYLSRLLGGESFIALVALDDGVVVGGLAAYELRKFEQARSEVYIYDLAVAETHQRRGIATALIRELTVMAASRKAHTVFVQADTGPEDAAAVALYSKLGRRERVFHFDIPMDGEDGDA